MSRYILNLRPELHVVNLSKSGARVSTLTNLVTSNKKLWDRIDPDIVLIHVGCNDIMFHPDFNPKPSYPRQVVYNINRLKNTIHHIMPNTKVIVSGLLPRLPGRYSCPEMTVRYNKETRKMGRVGPTINMPMLYHKNMWRSINKGLANENYFNQPDGLHLNDLGKQRLAETWCRSFN